TSPPANPDPTTWSLPDVLAWLRSKHFSEDVLEKFIEQDITGDVLLSLDDLKVLKEEIGILAFGKRVRVLNAIADLK
ncbi:sterile alpha motif/pointed domain-containing protein, partial [Flagelloscypha sp. PMI_526]